MATLNKFLFVGDSFTASLETNWDKKYGENVKFYAKVGRNATQLRSLLEKGQATLPKESEIDGVCLLIGVNNCVGSNSKPNTKNQEDVIQCIKLLKNKYKDKPLYVQRVFPVNSKYDKNYAGGWKNVNAAVKEINTKNKKHCDSTSGVYYIDTTKGFSSNAIFVEDKTSDGLHIATKYYKDYIKNISDAVANAIALNGSDGSGNGYPPVIKKLLPDSLSGKSYETSGFTPQFIAIHNMGGGAESTNQTAYDFWAKGSDGRNTSAHYCIEPGEIWQTLENTWIGHHIGSGSAGNPGYDAGARNNNTFGLEMADGDNIDKEAALENMIELTRHLMQTYDIPVKNVYYHKQISGNKTDCPWWILKNKKWDYFIKEIEKRNKNNEPIRLNLNPSENQNNLSNSGSLPNFDNREDLINMEDVKGVVLVHMPPHHFFSKKAKDKEWETTGYDRNFHFEVDSAGFKTKVDNTLITWGMQSNDRHTYIDRALFKNKPYKYVLNIGMFTSEGLTDYTVTEKILIDKIGKVLWDNGLQTKDLWREFDLNRAPSPFMYLEREQWKKFLREIDKQVKWRYENFGTPQVLKDREENLPDGDATTNKENVGKDGTTSRKCSLWKNPQEDTSTRIKILDANVAVKITDYDEIGMYKVTIKSSGLKGWIWTSSIKLDAEGEAYTIDDACYLMPRDRDEEASKDPDKDPEEDKSGEKNIPQPEITPTMTHEEYLKWKELTDPRFLDNFAGSCEPYDKGLDEILNAPITEDDRLVALTERLDTRNENTIYYNTVEGSPGGDGSHCAKNANELNLLIKPDPYKVDPIYPDLVIPPNYSTTDYNIKASNALPLTVLQEENGVIQNLEDFDSKNLFFDYDLLKDKEKKSKGKPVNYLDPYPYDDKIHELENHLPKVKIDEIEARLYDSNHPGDPIAQPIAKNFANVYDMAINQSKKIESRLVRIENTLATVLRNLGRIGARINVNCVYYGGQDVFGKYRTIRCMRDDRVNDACSMTLDQCLSCTRYEPIVGQIYEILDDTGVNGSVMMDNMQMSYMNLDDMKNLNRVERRNSTKKFVNVNREEETIPKKLTEEWEKLDKEKYIESIKENYTDEEELKKAIENIKQEDYAFKMNWLQTDLDTQEPDVKEYPTEGIKAKYKKQESETPVEDNSFSADLGGLEDGDLGYDTTIDKDLIDDNDLDYQEDLEKLDKINQGEWIDTREEADTFEENKYTSEDYYFEGFNSDQFTDGGSNGFASQAREKILEMAKKIVQDHNDNKACYSQAFRTNDYNKPVYGYDKKISDEKIVGYDCSSFVSCCYLHAGLKEITYKNTTDIYAYAQTYKDSGVKVWDATLDTLDQAKPGDIICTKGKGHTGIYMGNRQFAHSSTNKRGKGEQIRIDDAERFLKYSVVNGVFIRPKDLVAADEAAASSGTGVCPTNTKGPAVAAPSNAIIRFMKGQEGHHRVAGYYNKESFQTGGYGVTEWSPNLFKKLSPYPTPEKKSTEILIEYMKTDPFVYIERAIKKHGKKISDFKQHQIDAMASIAMNCGSPTLVKQECFLKMLVNPDDPKIPELIKTTKAPWAGHKARRKLEAKIYATGEYEFKAISIMDGPGKNNGTVTDNNGNGWLPGPIQ